MRLIAISILILTSFTELRSQARVCLNAYVWQFSQDIGYTRERTLLANDITDEVEDALSSNTCIILNRRNWGNFLSQVQSEKAIASLQEMPKELENSLKNVLKAEVVLFGTIIQDRLVGNISIKLSFQNILTSQILLSTSINIKAEDAAIKSYRAKIIKENIDKIIYPEATAKVENRTEYIAFLEAEKTNTIDSYFSFMKSYPNSAYFDEALKRYKQFKNSAEISRREDVVWDSIQMLFSEDNWHFQTHDSVLSKKVNLLNVFTSDFPNGKHKSDVKQQLSCLSKKVTIKNITSDAVWKSSKGLAKHTNSVECYFIINGRDANSVFSYSLNRSPIDASDYGPGIERYEVREDKFSDKVAGLNQGKHDEVLISSKSYSSKEDSLANAKYNSDELYYDPATDAPKHKSSNKPMVLIEDRSPSSNYYYNPQFEMKVDQEYPVITYLSGCAFSYKIIIIFNTEIETFEASCAGSIEIAEDSTFEVELKNVKINKDKNEPPSITIGLKKVN